MLLHQSSIIRWAWDPIPQGLQKIRPGRSGGRMYKSLILSFLVLLALCNSSFGENINTMASSSRLVEVAGTQQQLTGIAVSQEGRIFVNFPRWVDNIPMSVAEVLPNGTAKAYPNGTINQWNTSLNASNHLVCVQSVYIDANNNLWILDPAAPGFTGPVPGGPKLLQVNLASGKVVRAYHFNSSIAPVKSYLNDVRVDTRNGYAYMTDSGLGGIVVLNLNTGQARSVLGSNSSTKAEPIILEVDGRPLVYVDGSSARFNSDGIALDSQGQYLYYHALTGRTLYRIRTDYLRDSTLNESQIASRVEKLGQDCATDGMIMDRAGNLYLTCVEENAIMARQFSGSSNSPALMIVAQDQRLQWPDSMSLGPDGYLYVTASQFHLMPIIAEGKDLRKPPYMIFKVRTI